MNKKGYYRLLAAGLFLLMFVVIGVPVVVMNHLFYSNSVDVRVEKAEIIIDKIVEVMIESGELKDEVFGEFDLLEEANLDVDSINNGLNYISVEIYEGQDFDSKKKFIYGNRAYSVECFVESEKFPRCVEKEFVFGKYKVNFLVGNNEIGKGL